MTKILIDRAAKAQPQAEQANVSNELMGVIRFLLGESDLHGLHFGDTMDGKPFWWRKNLRQAIEAQPATQPHLFEFWWEKHMPNATQAEAWAAWTDAPSSKGVDVAQPAPAGEPVGYLSHHNCTGPYAIQFSKTMQEIYFDNCTEYYPVYRTPQPRKPVAPTDEQICNALEIDGADDWTYKVARVAIAEFCRINGIGGQA